MRKSKHLWDVEHPYYAAYGNYFSAGEHRVFASWSEFIDDLGDADDDLNLVYRWDWRHDTDDDEKRIGEPGNGALTLYYMGQRKAYCWSCEIRVTGADEDAIRTWLTPKWAKIKALWAPFSTERKP